MLDLADVQRRANKNVGNWMQRREFLGKMACGVAACGMPSIALADESFSLAKLANSRGLRFGSAVSRRAMGYRDYSELSFLHCDTLVGENAFKWRHMEPRERRHDRLGADWTIDLARRKNKRLRGHCFVWNHHDRMPFWLVDQASGLAKRDAREITRKMWRHGSFLGREFPSIKCWDAMNEAVDPATGKLRETEFTRLLGGRFFDLAFRIQRQKSPEARLVYNETMSWEAEPTHRNGVLRLLERGLARGLPIDALGIQSHIGKTLGRPRDERAWRDFLTEVRGMGLDVVLSEFDCSDRNISNTDPDYRDQRVAEHCKAYLDITLDFPNVTELIVWSLADGPSYMNRDSYPPWRKRIDGQALRGHPFDHKLRPKPMLTALKNSLANAPMR